MRSYAKRDTVFTILKSEKVVLSLIGTESCMKQNINKYRPFLVSTILMAIVAKCEVAKVY